MYEKNQVWRGYRTRKLLREYLQLLINDKFNDEDESESHDNTQ